jgi:hypothetical protein
MVDYLDKLQDIVMGEYWSDSVITEAIADCVDFEAVQCLKALQAGRGSFESRMVLQTYIVNNKQADTI